MPTFEKYVCLIASKFEVKRRCCSFCMICRAFLKPTDKCRQMQTNTCIFVRIVCRLAPPLNRTPNNERNANTKKNKRTPLITTRGGRPYRLATKRTTLISSFVPASTSKKNIGVWFWCELGFQPKPNRSIRRCICSLKFTNDDTGPSTTNTQLKRWSPKENMNTQNAGAFPWALNVHKNVNFETLIILHEFRHHENILNTWGAPCRDQANNTTDTNGWNKNMKTINISAMQRTHRRHIYTYIYIERERFWITTT